ncbi:ribosome small subunit-dependent GTPase A [Lacticaseibacillus casei]|uniref:Small ribosomal subunit biogenesis GTPase RsgA n=1 Tax=Lacticaseibacillus huelsenbergensis TaxID=3035291 RepID=A0ABY8DPR0_9LACO|nr:MULTISPECIES: ribosome small subunit-dependent GTPase A [Lacticaseibacillus]MDG3062753.1 ribosome small subunit-dependent GTPase A [Lacticaseibacillus sp. BCRC 81376]QVI38486.1 ribosome small subunit-dependent GTPase A [Lacticaseibacillus casei]QXG60298.1 ribosome small subunit-dependent GTPase A [Lacticaseibacillus casei]WFB38223.1 ribosome small subunit-dependent GTPase A [Lacticaseibacillus huelsenbergensis]WFB42648.1 ribosome small subunit-dependent GTPase A [Lacticaseibacillus huelsenb
MTLSSYGSQQTTQPERGLTLARVITTSHLRYTIVTDSGRYSAQVAGRLANMAIAPEDFPTVGDWVQVRLPDNSEDVAIIERLNERKTVFLRKSAGRKSDAQLVAANVDWLFLCMALDGNFNVRRMERYLAVAAASGAHFAIVLTKADKSIGFEDQLTAISEISGAHRIIVCDATTPDGLSELRAFMEPRETYAFLGSSGVGKTTLINHLLGSQKLETNAVRQSDAHGRHTTTSRQLMLLPNGSIVIDTPGMRELGLLDADVESAFADIQELSKHCRFNDCSHQKEPGCAVQQAVAEGKLSAIRVASYLSLQQEKSEHNDLRGRERENAKVKRMFGSKNQLKKFRRSVKKR